jgi:hypothetical protein
MLLSSDQRLVAVVVDVGKGATRKRYPSEASCLQRQRLPMRAATIETLIPWGEIDRKPGIDIFLVGRGPGSPAVGPPPLR